MCISHLPTTWNPTFMYANLGLHNAQDGKKENRASSVPLFYVCWHESASICHVLYMYLCLYIVQMASDQFKNKSTW